MRRIIVATAFAGYSRASVQAPHRRISLSCRTALEPRRVPTLVPCHPAGSVSAAQDPHRQTTEAPGSATPSTSWQPASFPTRSRTTPATTDSTRPSCWSRRTDRMESTPVITIAHVSAAEHVFNGLRSDRRFAAPGMPARWRSGIRRIIADLRPIPTEQFRRTRMGRRPVIAPIIPGSGPPSVSSKCRSRRPSRSQSRARRRRPRRGVA